MKNPRTLAVAGASVLAVLAGGAWMVNTWIVKPRRLLDVQLTASKNAAESLRKQLEKRGEIEAELRAVGATTLGAEEDVVKHRLRTALTAVAEGMSGVVVDQRIATPVTSPLVQSKGVPTTLKRTLRQRPDFTVVTGKLTCVGTLEQALRTLATLRAQPWAHRLDAFSITPANKERTRFTLEVEVATLFMPDLAPREDKEPVLVSPGTLSEQEWRPIAAKNIFVKPVRETPQAPVAQGTPPPPPPPPPPPRTPYEEWRLTAVMRSGRLGNEVWMRNSRTGDTLVLRAGDQVLDAKLIEATERRGVFEIGGKRYEIEIGEDLGLRREIPGAVGGAGVGFRPESGRRSAKLGTLRDDRHGVPMLPRNSGGGLLNC